MAHEHDALVPTRSFIAGLKVGDLAPDFSGRMAEVVRIAARKEDISGKLFVLYETRLGPTSTVTNSLKEDKIQRSLALTSRLNSAELDALEREIVAAREDIKCCF